jgi:hypothetical protein
MLYMTMAVLAGFAVILIMNLAAVMGFVPAKYISPNDVRGIAVEHNKTLYTLNFDQQNALLDIFNRASPITKTAADERKITFKNPAQIEKIVIYRFKLPDIEIRPVGYAANKQSKDQEHAHMVFFYPEWNAEGFLEEAAPNEMNTLLLKTYDQ